MWGNGDVSKLKREIRRLREDLDYLAGEVRRLRGRVTGGLRYDEDPERQEGEPEGGYVG